MNTYRPPLECRIAGLVKHKNRRIGIELHDTCNPIRIKNTRKLLIEHLDATQEEHKNQRREIDTKGSFNFQEVEPHVRNMAIKTTFKRRLNNKTLLGQ